MISNATEGRQIHRLLSRVDRRLRLNEALSRLAGGLWLLAGLLVTLKLTGLWESPLARAGTLAGYTLGLAAFVSFRFFEKRGLSRPAAVADASADLKDALRSAYAFLRLPERTEWMNLQVQRAASAADALAPVEIVPTEVPRPLYYSSGASVALLALLLWSPTWMSSLSAGVFSGSFAAATTAEREDAEPVADVLPLEEEAEALPDVEDSLDRLRRRDLELADRLRDLAEARESLAASQLEMDRLEMDLESFGESLESASPSNLDDLAEALSNRDPEEAAELLRKLAERLAEAPMSEELQALLESLKNANVQQADLAQMLENLENAAGGEMSLEEMKQALEAAAAQLENMGEQMAQQAQDAQMSGEQMQALQGMEGQPQAPSDQQMGQQQQAPGQAMQSAAGMMSNQVQMGQMAGDPSSAVPVDAGPAGDTTGPGGGSEEQVLGEATSLEVQLEMELLEAPKDREEPVPEEVFERLSREEKSTLNYEAVRRLGSYAEEAVLRRERVPLEYRTLVKNYFLSILAKTAGTSNERDTETDPGK